MRALCGICVCVCVCVQVFKQKKTKLRHGMDSVYRNKMMRARSMKSVQRVEHRVINCHHVCTQPLTSCETLRKQLPHRVVATTPARDIGRHLGDPQAKSDCIDQQSERRSCPSLHHSATSSIIIIRPIINEIELIEAHAHGSASRHHGKILMNTQSHCKDIHIDK